MAKRKMSEEQKAEMLRAVGLDWRLGGAAGLSALLTAIGLGGSASINISIIVANTIARMIAGRALSIAATRGLSVLAGPIGIAITALLIIPIISGTAYRVTLPSVYHIAYMRRAHTEEDYF